MSGLDTLECMSSLKASKSISGKEYQAKGKEFSNAILSSFETQNQLPDMKLF